MTGTTAATAAAAAALAVATSLQLLKWWNTTIPVRRVPEAERLSAIVVGGGMGGIVAAVYLAKLGVDAHIVEVERDFGGTWLLNKYPGCACDIPIHAYSFSFATKGDWSQAWAEHDEILAYVQGVARDNSLHARASFETKVESAEFDGKLWVVTTRDLRTGATAVRKANFFIVATGQLNKPATPPVKNWEAFPGEQFHTARWRHDVDLAGKRVVCVGTGASAIQALPEIAPRVKSLVIFQRSPMYYLLKRNFRFPGWAKWILSTFPSLRVAYRYYLLAFYESIWWMLIRNSATKPSAGNAAFTEHIRNEMRSQLPPDMMRRIDPQERLGCKRVLQSNDWGPMLLRPNVTLVSEAADRIEGNAVVSKSGVRHEADVIVWATGFDTQAFVPGISIRANGKELHEVWGSYPNAYHGITVAGFPNMALLYGPGTNQNNTSVIIYLETQMQHITKLIARVAKTGATSFDVKREAQTAYADAEQAALKTTSFNANCYSWYKDPATGKIVNNYSGSAAMYWWYTKGVRWGDYRIQ